MTTVFDQAYAAHRAGRLVDAERGYRAVLAANPDDASALHLFGVLRHQQGQHIDAVKLIARAAQLRPNDAALQLNLGNAYRALNRLDDAITYFRNALTLAPDFPLAYYNLGNAYAAAEKHETAVDAYKRALRLQPDNASTHNNLGNALNALGRHEDAQRAFIRALELQPGHAGAHNNLGMALSATTQINDAVAHFRAAISTEPSFVAAHFNLGNTLDAIGQHAEACAAFKAALALQPRFPLALYGLGNALAALGQHHEALPYYERAAGLDPSFSLAWLNLGTTHHALGAHARALCAFEQALRLTPDLAIAQMHRAVTLLTRGDFTRGWPAYEARLALPGIAATDPPALPRWQGEPIPKHTLLIRSEQGFGDTLQFVRFVPLARARAADVVLEVQPELIRLLAPAASNWRVTLIAHNPGKTPAADLYCPLLSLPLALGIDRDTLSPCSPYLVIPSAPCPPWRGALGGQAKRTFGIAWSGRIQAHENRALALAELNHLFALPDIDWIVLQPSITAAECAALAAHPHAQRIHRVDLQAADFAATAALAGQLDGIVSSDTAIAHLAGALGKPLWVMLPFAADWRWFQGEHSPWYPSARLIRQPAPGQWDKVIARIAQEIQHR